MDDDDELGILCDDIQGGIMHLVHLLRLRDTWMEFRRRAFKAGHPILPDVVYDRPLPQYGHVVFRVKRLYWCDSTIIGLSGFVMRYAVRPAGGYVIHDEYEVEHLFDLSVTSRFRLVPGDPIQYWVEDTSVTNATYIGDHHTCDAIKIESYDEHIASAISTAYRDTEQSVKLERAWLHSISIDDVNK